MDNPYFKNISIYVLDRIMKLLEWIIANMKHKNKTELKEVIELLEILRNIK